MLLAANNRKCDQVFKQYKHSLSQVRNLEVLGYWPLSAAVQLYNLSKFPVHCPWHTGSFLSMLTGLWSRRGFLSFTPCVLPLFIRVTKAAFTEGPWSTSSMSLAKSRPCAARLAGRGGNGLVSGPQQDPSPGAWHTDDLRKDPSVIRTRLVGSRSGCHNIAHRLLGRGWPFEQD